MTKMSEPPMIVVTDPNELVVMKAYDVSSKIKLLFKLLY